MDENALQREILNHYIRMLGMECTGAASGEEALAALRRAAAGGRPYAAVITAFRLPGMDGMALARAVRQEPSLAATPLLLTTVFDERGQGEQALQAGFSGYLKKPLKQAQVLAAITRLMQ